MKKVLLYGCYNGDNLGDDLILDAVYEYLNRNNVEPSIFTTNPDDKNYFNLRNKYHIVGEVKQSTNNFFSKVKHKISVFKQYISKRSKDYDAIIFVGGGYINGVFGIKNLIKIYLLTRSFKKYNKKIFFTGQTVGPFENKISQILAKKIYKNANKIIVREKYSKEQLDKWNLNNILVGDDAYLLNNEFKEEDNIDKYVIINIKDFKGYGVWEDKYIEIIKELVNKGEQILCIPFRSDINSKEYNTNLKLVKELRKHNINAKLYIPVNIQELLKVYSHSKFIIGTAYHSIVLSLLCGKEAYSFFVGKYYQRKIKGVLELYELEGTNCANFESDEETNKMINNIKANRKGNNIERKTEEIRKKLFKIWDEIIKEI